jgi:hypothetical protein
MSGESTNSQTACAPEKGLHTTTDEAHGQSCTTHVGPIGSAVNYVGEI